MLTLPIKKKWFDMIASGEKTEEYRENTPYWAVRFLHEFELGYYFTFEESLVSTIRFRNGYRKDSPALIAKCHLGFGTGRPEWGAEPGKDYFILHIHDIQKEV